MHPSPTPDGEEGSRRCWPRTSRPAEGCTAHAMRRCKNSARKQGLLARIACCFAPPQASLQRGRLQHREAIVADAVPWRPRISVRFYHLRTWHTLCVAGGDDPSILRAGCCPRRPGETNFAQRGCLAGRVRIARQRLRQRRREGRFRVELQRGHEQQRERRCCEPCLFRDRGAR